MASTTADGIAGDAKTGPRWLVKAPRELIILRALLIMAAPIYALATWQPIYYHTWTRHFALPVLACELGIVILAIATRLDIGAAIRALSPLTRFAAFAWLAISAWASLGVAEPGQGSNYLFAITSLHALFGLTIWWKLQHDWAGYGPHMLASAALGVFLYAAIVLMLTLSVGDTPFDWVHLGPGVSHDRQLAFYGLTLSGIAGGLVAFARGRGCTLFWLAMLVAGCWLTVWAGGRAGFAAMIGALALTGWLVGRGRWLRFAGLTSGAVILAIALSYAFVPHQRYGFDSIAGRAVTPNGPERYTNGEPRQPQSVADEFTSGRAAMWGNTLDHIAERPLVGHGEGQFRSTVHLSYTRYNHPHNSPLQLLFQWGALGTLALLAMLWGTLRTAFVARASFPRRAIVALGPLSGLAAMSLLEGSAFHIYPVMMMVMCFAIIAAALARTSPGSAGARS